MSIRLGIRNRLLFLVGVMLVFMGAVVAFFVYQANGTKGQMIDKVGQIMNEAAQDKIMVATRNMATSIGEAIKGVSAEDERVAIIRKLINDIRFEPDKSGYFFVYKGTVNVILPPNAQIEGKDLVDSKDVGGIFFVRELQQKAQAGGGFVPYVFAKPGKGDQPKLSYSTMIPGTAGDFAWGGAASTYFWIDPVEDLIVIFLTQLLPSDTYPIRRELRTLVYSAFERAHGYPQA